MTHFSSKSIRCETDDLCSEFETITRRSRIQDCTLPVSSPYISRAVDSSSARGQVRILVDTALNTGAAEYSNLGDVAMLQVGVRRLQHLWPSARIEVLTESPAKLALFCPGAKPLARAGRDLWIGNDAIIGGFDRLLPPQRIEWLRQSEQGLPAPISRRFSVARGRQTDHSRSQEREAGRQCLLGSHGTRRPARRLRSWGIHRCHS